MLLKPCFLALALILAMSAFAQSVQPAEPVDGGDCKAQQAVLERDMELARSRGQMLRRRELAEALDALQVKCNTPKPAQSRQVRIDRLEQDIRALRSELAQAEEQLRALRNELP